jgi:hypothetical protein
MIDLEYFTEELITDGFEAVVFIDANEPIDHRVRSQNHDHKYKSDKGFHIDGSIDGSIATYTQNCGLSNILSEGHAEYGAEIPDTHLRGSKQILTSTWKDSLDQQRKLCQRRDSRNCN